MVYHVFIKSWYLPGHPYFLIHISWICHSIPVIPWIIPCFLGGKILVISLTCSSSGKYPEWNGDLVIWGKQWEIVGKILSRSFCFPHSHCFSSVIPVRFAASPGLLTLSKLAIRSKTPCCVMGSCRKPSVKLGLRHRPLKKGHGEFSKNGGVV